MSGSAKVPSDMGSVLLNSLCAGGSADGEAALHKTASSYDGDVDREDQENSLALSELARLKRSGRVRRRKGRLAAAREEMVMNTAATRAPSTPPPLPGRRRASSAASSPICVADDDALLEQKQQQQQQQKPQDKRGVSRIPRSVSFCEVVKVSNTAVPRKLYSYVYDSSIAYSTSSHMLLLLVGPSCHEGTIGALFLDPCDRIMVRVLPDRYASSAVPACEETPNPTLQSVLQYLCMILHDIILNLSQRKGNYLVPGVFHILFCETERQLGANSLPKRFWRMILLLHYCRGLQCSSRNRNMSCNPTLFIYQSRDTCWIGYFSDSHGVKIS